MDIGLPLWPFEARKVGVRLCYSISDPPRLAQWYQRISFTSFAVYQFLNPAEINVWMFVCVSLLYIVYVQLDYRIEVTVQRDLKHWSELRSIAFISYTTIDCFFFLFMYLSAYLLILIYISIYFFTEFYLKCPILCVVTKLVELLGRQLMASTPSG